MQIFLTTIKLSRDHLGRSALSIGTLCSQGNNTPHHPPETKILPTTESHIILKLKYIKCTYLDLLLSLFRL